MVQLVTQSHPHSPVQRYICLQGGFRWIKEVQSHLTKVQIQRSCACPCQLQVWIDFLLSYKTHTLPAPIIIRSIFASTEWRIHKYHKRTDKQTEWLPGLHVKAKNIRIPIGNRKEESYLTLEFAYLNRVTSPVTASSLLVLNQLNINPLVAISISNFATFSIFNSA